VFGRRLQKYTFAMPIREAAILILLAVVGTLAPLRARSPVQAQDSFDSCDAGINAVDQRDLPSLPWNDVYVTFNLERPLDFMGPGSWSVTVEDWGDGTGGETYTTPPDPDAVGPDVEDVLALYNPPKQAIIRHTYAEPGTYTITFTTSGTRNTISDGSGSDEPCGGPDEEEAILFAPETPAAPTTIGPSAAEATRTAATPRAGAISQADDGAGSGGGVSMVLVLGTLAVVAAAGGGAFWWRTQQAAATAAPAAATAITADPAQSPTPSVSLRPVMDAGSQTTEDGGDGIVLRAVLGAPGRLDIEEEA
jgi:hypothetical protein